MKIAILDQENGRAIVAEVPEYLAVVNVDHETIAHAIFDALGLGHETEYMIGEFNIAIDVNSLNSGKGYGDNTRRLDEFTSTFKDDSLEALNAYIG